MRVKATRPSYERTPCIIPGCKRGTTKMERRDDGSAHEWICPNHWRQVPLMTRKKLSRYGQRARRFEREGDVDRARLWARRWWILWDRIKAELTDPGSTSLSKGDMPVAMQEELRKLCL